MVFSVHNHGFYGVPNTFCQEKHQHFHADRQLVTKKEISIKINLKSDSKRSWPAMYADDPGSVLSEGGNFFSFVFSFFFFFLI